MRGEFELSTLDLRTRWTVKSTTTAWCGNRRSQVWWRWEWRDLILGYCQGEGFAIHERCARCTGAWGLLSFDDDTHSGTSFECSVLVLICVLFLNLARVNKSFVAQENCHISSHFYSPTSKLFVRVLRYLTSRFCTFSSRNAFQQARSWEKLKLTFHFRNENGDFCLGPPLED